MAGNEPGFEEAIRALFADKRERFDEMVEPWPEHIRDHAKKLAAAAFAPVNQGGTRETSREARAG